MRVAGDKLNMPTAGSPTGTASRPPQPSLPNAPRSRLAARPPLPKHLPERTRATALLQNLESHSTNYCAGALPESIGGKFLHSDHAVGQTDVRTTDWSDIEKSTARVLARSLEADAAGREIPWRQLLINYKHQLLRTAEADKLTRAGRRMAVPIFDPKVHRCSIKTAASNYPAGLHLQKCRRVEEPTITCNWVLLRH